LTNAFSKKFENRRHTLALYFVFYNFCSVHKTLGVTSAMAAGVAPVLMNMADVVGLIEAKAAGTPAVRGTYRKKVNEISN
jgi:hypothetical protein